MARVQHVKLKVFQIALVWMRPLFREDVVPFAPDDQRRRLVFAKVFLPLWIERRVRAVAVKQLELDLLVPRTVEQELVVNPVIGRNGLWISDPVGVLPLGCLKRQEIVSEDIGIFWRLLLPVALMGVQKSRRPSS